MEQKHTREQLLAEQATLIKKRNTILSQIDTAHAKRHAGEGYADPLWYARAKGALYAVRSALSQNSAKLAGLRQERRVLAESEDELLAVLKECAEYIDCLSGRRELWRKIVGAIRKIDPEWAFSEKEDDDGRN